jgi:hypothetical protein
MSSLSFIGNATSYLKIPTTESLKFGTGDFTIEWYQYQTDTNFLSNNPTNEPKPKMMK